MGGPPGRASIDEEARAGRVRCSKWLGHPVTDTQSSINPEG